MATSDGRYQDAWPGEGSSRESSLLLLADDYFCIAVDEHSGRPRASSRVTGFGLAAALLAELVLSGRLEIQADQVRAIDVEPPADGLRGWVHGQMVSHPQHRTLQTWLEFLGPPALDAVAAVPAVLARLPGPLTSLRKQLEVVVGTAVLTNRS